MTGKITTIRVFGHKEPIRVTTLVRLVRNILPGDIMRLDFGDGISARWVNVAVWRTYPCGRSPLSDIPRTHIDFSYPGYPKEGSTWGAPIGAPGGGLKLPSAEKVQIYRPQPR